MAAQLTQAGTITREQTFLPIRRFDVAANTTVVKGNALYINASGQVALPTTSGTADAYRVKVVALGSADNGNGDNGGELDVPCAVRGHFVTVVAGGVIRSGQKIQLETDATANLGKVVAAAAGDADAADAFGIYWAKESGTIGGSDELEQFVDTENWDQGPTADNDIIEVQLF